MSTPAPPRETGSAGVLLRLAVALAAVSLAALLVAGVALWWGVSEDPELLRPPAPLRQVARSLPSPIAAADSAPPEEEAVTLVVTLRGTDTAPLPGLTVRALGEAWTSDAGGRFTLQTTQGAEVVVAPPPPWAVAWPPVLRAEEAEVDVVLERRCAGGVRLRWPDGAPAAGARVRAGWSPWRSADGEGRLALGERRCGVSTLTVQEPPEAPSRQAREATIDVAGDEEVEVWLEDAALVGDGTPPPAELREVLLTVVCQDCPDRVGCRDGEHLRGWTCEGALPTLRCTCPVEAAGLVATWDDVLTEAGVPEPVGVLPPEVEAWTLELPEGVGGFQGRWTGLMPCEWQLSQARAVVAREDCAPDGSFAQDGLRPGPYRLEVSYGALQVAERELVVGAGEETDLGALSPGR